MYIIVYNLTVTKIVRDKRGQPLHFHQRSSSQYKLPLRPSISIERINVQYTSSESSFNIVDVSVPTSSIDLKTKFSSFANTFISELVLLLKIMTTRVQL